MLIQSLFSTETEPPQPEEEKKVAELLVEIAGHEQLLAVCEAARDARIAAVRAEIGKINRECSAVIVSYVKHRVCELAENRLFSLSATAALEKEVEKLVAVELKIPSLDVLETCNTAER
jgi:hypothetical protein